MGISLNVWVLPIKIRGSRNSMINTKKREVVRNIGERIESGATILNVSGGKDTADIVRKIKSEHPAFPVLATGGPTEETIRATIEAGANAITYTPPYNGEIMSALMDRYRDK